MKEKSDSHTGFISLRIKKNVFNTAVKIEKFQQNITYILNLCAVLFLAGTTPTLLQRQDIHVIYVYTLLTRVSCKKKKKKKKKKIIIIT